MFSEQSTCLNRFYWNLIYMLTNTSILNPHNCRKFEKGKVRKIVFFTYRKSTFTFAHGCTTNVSVINIQYVFPSDTFPEHYRTLHNDVSREPEHRESVADWAFCNCDVFSPVISKGPSMTLLWKSYRMFTCVLSPHQWSRATGFNCRPGPCIGVAGAMSASRGPCTVVWFIVWQRQSHGSPPANELTWLLEPKFLAKPVVGSNKSRVEVYLSRQRGFDV